MKATNEVNKIKTTKVNNNLTTTTMKATEKLSNEEVKNEVTNVEVKKVKKVKKAFDRIAAIDEIHNWILNATDKNDRLIKTVLKATRNAEITGQRIALDILKHDLKKLETYAVNFEKMGLEPVKQIEDKKAMIMLSINALTNSLPKTRFTKKEKKALALNEVKEINEAIENNLL
jgi:hypothetical protein